MAFRDSWHRALVYFGLAEERDPYVEEDDPYEPEAELEDRYRERPNVRRLGSRRRRDEFDDIFADDDVPARPTAQLRSVRPGAGNGRSDVRVHLVIPKSFNDAQQIDGGMQRIADKVFMLTPRNVEISAEERAELIEKGFFNQS
jgi:cell division inhibitor SepF